MCYFLGSFLKDICLKQTIDKGVDWSGRCETHRPPHRKRASLRSNQLIVFLNSKKIYENSHFLKYYYDLLEVKLEFLLTFLNQ
jgi:hypothetical protein